MRLKLTHEIFISFIKKQNFTMQHTETVVVIGAGAFGLSTALELKQRGYREVIVLDRHVPPVSIITAV